MDFKRIFRGPILYIVLAIAAVAAFVLVLVLPRIGLGSFGTPAGTCDHSKTSGSMREMLDRSTVKLPVKGGMPVAQAVSSNWR